MFTNRLFILCNSFNCRTMLDDESVYITVVNFNMHRTIIDIDNQFYPVPAKAEIIIDSTPDIASSKDSDIQRRSMKPLYSSDIDLNHIELLPFECLLLRVNPT